MLMDNLFLNFKGFQPSRALRLYLDDKLKSIHDEAPYGSTLKASFHRTDHLFKGIVTVYSSVGKFFAEASGEAIDEVAKKLSEKIKRKLNRWKSQRYFRDFTDPVCFSKRSGLDKNWSDHNLGA